jgi:RimJ/RimL family protein N-acetyltransferase
VIIETPRLQLVAYQPEHLLALMESDQQFEQSFGLPPADGLGTFLQSDEVSPHWVARLRASTSGDPWLHGFAIVDRAAQAVVGGVGFKGPPNDQGEVEIAYGIVPSFQNRGYATEAAAAGVEFAFGREAVERVIAHTKAENAASTRVLEKCGFLRIGDVIDPEDGLVCRWELPRRVSEPRNHQT